MIDDENDWWNAVEVNWEALYTIIDLYVPLNGDLDIDGKYVKNLGRHLEVLKNNKDRELSRYFSAAWNLAPDSPEIHNIPKWDLLCDLCSENYVLYENDIPDNCCEYCGYPEE